jgi:hypothetical protein
LSSNKKEVAAVEEEEAQAGEGGRAGSWCEEAAVNSNKSKKGDGNKERGWDFTIPGRVCNR